ncbi:MAG: immunoglobulin domain-containing protein, partial [Verrucomicrobia bacterium]|nr:immunoglobulin domain-containing protein [Verrucomicrobiota bacterium]
MKTQKMISVGAVSRFVTLFILLASLLVLPKAHAAVGDSFTIDGLNYTVLSVNSFFRTGTVSVRAASLNLSGNITIPASVASEKVIYSVVLIPAEAFRSIKGLVTITIPENVAEIGERAFQNCGYLTGVFFEGNAPSVGADAFGEPAIIYYKSGTTGWTNPWEGRPTALWGPPEITKQPQSQAVMEGDPVTLSVVAEGTEPLGYQWYKDGVLIGGATGASYTISSVSAGDQGSYTVTVSNILGDATSSPAVITIKQEPVITWAAPAAITYGTPLGTTQLNATADVEGSFVYTPAAGTILDAGTHQLSVKFIPTDTVNYTSASKSVKIVVNKATPVITWAYPAAITYGTPLSGTQLNATADVKGSFDYTPAAGTILDAGTHQLSGNFTPTDALNYASVSKSVPIVVNKATPVITWVNPAAITYGTPLSAAQLNATADVEGFFAYTPASGTILDAGTHQLSVKFIPADPLNYKGASKSVEIVVNKATPVITWATPAAITYGTPLSAAQLNATADVKGSFDYTPAAGTILDAGTQTLRTVFTPKDTVNYKSAKASVELVVNPATPVITWATPAAITYGTPLSATQLNATADVEGSFEYKPAAGTILDVGTHKLLAKFTPTNTTNYNTVTAGVELVVK